MKIKFLQKTYTFTPKFFSNSYFAYDILKYILKPINKFLIIPINK